MNDPYGPVAWPNGTDDDLPDRIWMHGDFMPVQEFPVAELTGGFTSGAFIKAALRRRIRFWCAISIVGLLIGLGLYVKFPSAYYATTTILLTNSPNQDAATAIKTDTALALSLPVAEQVVQQLRLQESANSLMAASTVTDVTGQVLTVTVAAPSADAALARTDAMAAAFLQFRTTYLEIQQQELFAELNQQQKQAQQRLDSINAQINKVTAEPSSQAQQASLKKLQTEEQDASNALDQVKGYVVYTMETSKTSTDSMVHDSKVLNPATLAKHSHVKSAVLDVAGGLVGGMALGMGIAVAGALISDRLRRRDEIAEAFGAPVGLSVGLLRKSRRLRVTTPRQAARQDLDMRRVVAHLRNSVPGSSVGPASLAVVAVDDAQAAAQAVAALAVSYASEGKRVIVADLSDKTHLARLLGVQDAGVHAVSQGGANILVMVPESDDVAPVGPLQGRTLSAVLAKADKALVAASNSAAVLLTLATLDPAFGSEYLATWATDAVVMVTVGQSSEERIRGVRQLILLAEMRLDSVVLVGADKSDQSIGVSETRDESIFSGPM